MLFLCLLVAQLALFASEPQVYSSKHTDSTTITGADPHPQHGSHAFEYEKKFEKFIHASLHDDDNPCLDIIDFLAYKRTYNFTEDVSGEPSFSVVKGSHMFNTQFNCGYLFREGTGDQRGIWPPHRLQELRDSHPKFLYDLTLGGKVAVLNDSYRADRPYNSIKSVWKASEITMMAAQPCSYDGNPSCELAFSKYNYLINGSHGIVVGSQSFWAEAAAFRHGARHITTIERQVISTDHIQLSVMTPHEAHSRYLNHTMHKADFIISHSSLEHDGLGLFGEPLNAFGDLLSVARMNCLLKNHGILFLAVPVGKDGVHYNSHRTYGYHRLSMLFSLGNACFFTMMYCFALLDHHHQHS